MTDASLSEPLRPFHRSKTYSIALLSWCVLPIFIVACSIDRAFVMRWALVPLWIILGAHAAYQFSVLWSGYRAQATFTVLIFVALLTGFGAATVSGWQAGITIAVCLALFHSFAANWVLSIAWQLDLGIASE